ncbi:MAG: hypothetical protein WBA57_03515, partial [Elainellaceae cyanobacterium]
EKLRQKIGISVSRIEQQQVKDELVAEMPNDIWNQLIEKQRQTVALPFWGIAGLGLLFGISMVQPLDLIVAIAGGFAAIKIQRRGWTLQAKRLVIQTLEDIEARMQAL